VAKPEMVVLVPIPVEVIFPGLLVKVQVPVDGNPLSTTLPVALLQVGWVMVPITGSVGVSGWVLITAFADKNEVQPLALVTVNE
jgi:hypothetical protein